MINNVGNHIFNKMFAAYLIIFLSFYAWESANMLETWLTWVTFFLIGIHFKEVMQSSYLKSAQI